MPGKTGIKREEPIMTKNFNELFKKLPAEVQARALAKAEKDFAELPLSELREAKQLTQVELAKRLKVDQAAISKLERRTDMYLSTLRDVIHAMGGQLQLCATFPSGEIRYVTLDIKEAQAHKPRKRNAAA